MRYDIALIGIAVGLASASGCQKDWDDPEEVREHQREAAEERREIEDRLERSRAEDGEDHAEEVRDLRENIREERAEGLEDDREEVEELQEDLEDDDPAPAIDGEGAGPENAALEAIRGSGAGRDGEADTEQ